MKQQAEATIQNLRREIDELDATLLKLLRRRVSLVLATNFAKRVAGRAVLDGERERLITSRAFQFDPLTARVYAEVIRACRKLAEEAAVSDPDDDGDPGAPVERADGR